MTRARTVTALPVLRLDRRTVLRCAPDQSMQPLVVEGAAWADPTAVPAFRDGRIVSVFDYTSTWTWWERHPTGDEFVHVLTGDVVFHVEGDDGRRSVTLGANAGVLVPRGAWHRAEIVTPATVLFLTPAPAYTEHRDA